MKRTLISLDRRSLIARINAGDPLALAEGRARNESRARKGKAPVKAYEPVGVTATAPQADPLASIPDAVLQALAARLGLQVPTAPAPVTHVAPNPDVATWEDCLAKSASRWEAYDRMERVIGPRQRRRIAAAAGVTVGSVSNAISKYRRGETPVLPAAWVK